MQAGEVKIEFVIKVGWNCPKCGCEDTPRREGTGDLPTEVVLWLISVPLIIIGAWLFIMAPIVYRIYRVYPSRNVCTKCGHSERIPYGRDDF